MMSIPNYDTMNGITNPYSLRLWLNKLEKGKSLSLLPIERYAIYEKALYYLPRSYKLWHSYLIER
jgi:pre-mRNA-splicing factor SYF1